MRPKRDLGGELKGVLRRELLRRLGPEAKDDLGGEPLGDLLVIYLNWRDRIPAPRPRAVRLSAEVQANIDHQPGLPNLVRRIEAGDDLTPHLSKRVETTYCKDDAAEPLAQRRDLDLLLADWGIHHLHFSSEIRLDGWVKRGSR